MQLNLKRTIAPMRHAALAMLSMLALAAAPGTARADTGKLPLTGGVSSIDGAAGGGITPWAVIGTNASQGEWGANVFGTRVNSQDYALDVVGVAASWNDRVELSLAQQAFNTRQIGAALGLGTNFTFRQDIVGVKVRLAGDAVLDSDTLMPQISMGVLHKRNNQAAVVKLVGAKSASGTDVYVSATKLFLAKGVLVNATLRATKANQNGLLGFGGDKNDSMRLQPELSVAWLLRNNLALGAEWRKKPSNLGFAREQNWSDVFFAWAPTKNISATLAYAQLGDIATIKSQRGWYLSLQAAF
jgi:hypothetical protein